MTPPERREAITFLVAEQNVSVRRACAAVALSRAAYYRPSASREHRDAPVIGVLNDLVGAHHGWGFRMCFDRLRLGLTSRGV